jgi:flagellar biosynthesis/type III secretory pathway protein FliH
MASRSNHAGNFTFHRPAWFAVTLLLLLSPSAYSQAKPTATPLPPEPTSLQNKSDSPTPDFGSPESEMRARNALKAEKKEYDENLARAREISELGHQLAKAYEARQTLGADDGKKLDRLEKLTKKVRNEAGGSESNPDGKDIPAVMATAVKQVAEAADELRDLVEKTPRHVISASVIDQANKLLGLIQHVKFNR